jgi:hypothetical protein
MTPPLQNPSNQRLPLPTHYRPTDCLDRPAANVKVAVTLRPTFRRLVCFPRPESRYYQTRVSSYVWSPL